MQATERRSEIHDESVYPAAEREKTSATHPKLALWAVVVFMIGAAPLVSFLAVPPDFDTQAVTIGREDVESLVLLRARGIVVLGVLLASSLYLLASGQAKPGALPICAAGLVFAATGALSGVFGLVPRLRGTILVQPAMFALLFLLPPISRGRLARWVRWIIIGHAYAALAAAVLLPARVLQASYGAGWLPGLPYRLHGLGVHANGLGPFMVAYFALRWFVGRRARGVSVHDLVALLVLILAQSKMAWATFGLVAVLALAQNERIRLPWARWPVVALAVLMAIVMTDMTDSIGVVGKAAGVLPIDNQSQAYTLTGRTQVWRETLYLWEQNRWFGYGPGLWDMQMQERYRDVLGWTPPAAHSQFYQTLGESGLVGLAGLGLYLGTLVATALRLGGEHPVVPSLVVLLIGRGITEPTLSSNLESAFAVHFWVVAFLVLAHRAHARRSRRAREVP